MLRTPPWIQAKISSFEEYNVFIASFKAFITLIFKSLVIPVIWLAIHESHHFLLRIAPFFALNRIFFSS